jgi:C_GCAxxG_C_C family probable redox protein
MVIVFSFQIGVISMTQAEKAGEKFMSGFTCSQAVLHSYAPELGVDSDMALKIANGFGAGMGRKQEVCGAISGAIMVLGLLYGRGEHDGADRHEKTYTMVQNLIDAFVNKYSTISCKQLLPGCCLLTEEGRRRFHDDNLREKCREFVETVCGILDGLQPTAP